MAAALTFTAAAAAAAIAGVKNGGNTNGNNSASWTFAGGTPGALDTIANAEFLKGLPTISRIRTFFATSFASQADLNAAIAALGIHVSTFDASTLRLITAAPGVPTATITTIAATGVVRVSLAASQSA